MAKRTGTSERLMKIIFMGTPEFAVPALKYLAASEAVRAVFTQPDKPRGRKALLFSSAVKEAALGFGIPVYQPATLKDGEALQIIKTYEPDLIVVAAYGKILPLSILNAPKFGAINIHASLLPKLRGAAPIQRSVINGEKTTGITTMQMDAGVDTGDILLQSALEIGENETYGELSDRLSVLGASVLGETLKLLKEGKLKPIKQDGGAHTCAPPLSKSDSPIDWTKSAKEIHDKVRGQNPWPSACTVLGGKTVKIHKTALCGTSSQRAGAVSVTGGSLVVSCGDGNAVEIIEIQPEGKRAMTAAEYLRGYKIN